MKLQSFEVRRNPETAAIELLLSVSIPLEIIDSVENMFSEDAKRILGSALYDILEQIKRNES